MLFVRLLLAGAACLPLTLPTVAQAQPGPASPTPQVLSEAPTSAEGRRVLASAEAEIADPVREARRTMPQVRKRFQTGLPNGAQCLLLVRVVEGDTTFRAVAARVIGWRDGRVQALLPAAATSSGPPVASEKIPVSFPESAALDWTILRADGREEGNFVGRYLETAEQVQAMQLR
jgi:hypothetical protein